MAQTNNPTGMLPLAFVGIVVGGLVTVGCGYVVHLALKDHHGSPSPSPSAGKVSLKEKVEWAAWFDNSFSRHGPDWYFQVQIEGDRRAFTMPASRVPDSIQNRWKIPAGLTTKNRHLISSLPGKTATVVVDSGVAKNDVDPTPYISALSVEGDTIAPLVAGQSGPVPLWARLGAILLFGTGMLFGVGLIGTSTHHVYLCIQYCRDPR